MRKHLLNPLTSILNSLPLMLSIILLLGLIKEFVSYDQISTYFSGHVFYDTFLGSLLGSLFAGNSMNSYVIGNELMMTGVSRYAITSFLVAWVTVGLVQLPLEAKSFGTSFALKRNLLSGLLSIGVALITVSLWRILS